MEKQTFLMLADLNVSEKVETRDGLSYLSWAWAWRHFKEACPDAIYEIIINQQTGLPYFESAAGVMVYTKVTACGETHMMWLPVMDSHNKAMKAQPYEVKTKNGTIFVKAFDMFDVNKTIMRCLTKNLAMFGLGLYIYAGEDLPEDDGAKRTSEEDINVLKRFIVKLYDGDKQQARAYFEEHCIGVEDPEKYQYYLREVNSQLRQKKEAEDGTGN